MKKEFMQEKTIVLSALLMDYDDFMLKKEW